MVTGIQIRVGTPGSVPSKPGAATPMTVSGVPAQPYGGANHRRVAAKAVEPETMLQNSYRAAIARAVVFRRKHTAEIWPHTNNWK